MTASSASSKAKAKFSSRNLSAVYKAPALRGVELSGNGVSSSGLNRMLVLKAPVRGGVQATTKANAVAAPTPINTPSLRKENNGQDVNVSLVPAGKSGGWGIGSDGSVEREETNVAHAEVPHASAAEPQRPTYHARAVAANAWNGGVASLSRTSSSSSGGVAAVAPAGVGRGSSGRWGDDAVEEDLAQSEVHREMERKREFPELPDHQNQTGHMQMRFHEHSYPQQYPGYSQDPRALHPDAAYHREAEYYGNRPPAQHAPPSRLVFGPPSQFERCRHHGYEGRGDAYRESGYHQRPPQQYMDERGYREHYHSNQGARYDGFSRNEPRAEYDRHYGGFRNADDYRNDPQDNYEPRNNLRGPEEFYQAGQAHGGYGPRYYREYPTRPPTDFKGTPRADFERPSAPMAQSATSDAHSEEDNQAEHSGPEGHSRQPNGAAAWRDPSASQIHASPPSSVWKMSESEVVSSKQVPEYQRTIVNVQQYPRSAVRSAYEGVAAHPSASTPAASQVRILKRNGPRMLFDPKSGTMVEVEESASSRRSNTSTPARDSSHSKNENAADTPHSSQPSTVKSEDADRPVQPTATKAAQESPLAVAESTVIATESVREDRGNSKTETKEKKEKQRKTVKERTQDRKTRVRAQPSEATSKRVAIGGKMKKVVVAYRPVVDADQSTKRELAENHRTRPTIVNVAQESVSQPQPLETSTKHKVRESAFRKSEVSCAVPAKSAKIERARSNRREDVVTKESIRATTESKAKPTRSTEKRVVEHTPATVASTPLVKANAATRFDELKAFSAGDGVVFVDEDQSAQDQFEDDDATFTTVKSRRAVLLERKRQREQLVAALSGFHERGGVKRTGTRVVIPPSLQRFGKKGLLVGFRTSTSESSSAVAAPPPQLVKPFIEVIRPTSSADELKETGVKTTEKGLLATKKMKKSKKDTQRTSKPHGNSSSETSSTETPTQPVKSAPEEADVEIKRHEKISSCQPPTVEMVAPITEVALVKTSPAVEVKGEQAAERSESYPQRERRGSAQKKGVKKVYVAKQSSPVVEPTSEPSQPPPVTATTLLTTQTSATPDLPENVAEVTKGTKVDEKQTPVILEETAVLKPRAQTKAKPRKSSVTSQEETSPKPKSTKPGAAVATESDRQTSPKVKPIVKNAAKPKRKKPSPESVEVAEAETSKTKAPAVKVETTKAEVSKPEVTKAGKATAPATKADVTKVQVRKSEVANAQAAKTKVVKAELTKAKVTKVEEDTAKVTKVEPVKTELPKASSSSTAVRRPSKAKTASIPKTATSTSTQKIYKKVYVVKTASTAAMSSPSAA